MRRSINCRKCGCEFESSELEDQIRNELSPVFDGRRFQIPVPKECPACREQLRCAFRNERALYKRKCDLTGANIISMYRPDAPFPVYEVKAWYGDGWNVFNFSAEVDLSRSFLNQLHELKIRVPRTSVIQQGEMENCSYCNRASNNKNCYLIFSSNRSEDCYYCIGCNSSKNCSHCYTVANCELLFGSRDCFNCYDSRYMVECDGCSSSSFLYQCTGCTDCFMCTNLLHKQHYIRNVKFTPARYRIEIAKIQFGSYKSVLNLSHEFEIAQGSAVVRAYFGNKNEDSSGNFLFNTKNAKNCVECVNLEDSVHVQKVNNAHHCVDLSYFGQGLEYAYMTHACGLNCQRICFCNETWMGSYDCFYCDQCTNCNHLFGCIGMRNASYCIFNKRYDPSEYEKLVAKIIEAMLRDGEWGEYFPASYSPFSYYETVAHDYDPLDESTAVALGFNWNAENQLELTVRGSAVAEMPDDIHDVDQSVCDQVYICDQSGKQFKILPVELSFYRKMNVPLPRVHYNEYLSGLIRKRRRRLLERTCSKCGKETLSVHSQRDRPQIACEECFAELLE